MDAVGELMAAHKTQTHTSLRPRCDFFLEEALGNIRHDSVAIVADA